MAKVKILIVDDDIDLIEGTKAILESQNYEVLTANSGKEGLERLQQETPNLLILDVMMDSNLDGYNNLHKIKKIPKIKDIPIIMLTGMAGELGVNLREATEDFDNVVFYDKPINPQILLEQIEIMLK